MKTGIYDFNLSAERCVEDLVNTPFDKIKDLFENVTEKFEDTRLESIATGTMELYNWPVDGLLRGTTLIAVGIPLFYSMKGLNKIGVMKTVGDKYDVYFERGEIE